MRQRIVTAPKLRGTIIAAQRQSEFLELAPSSQASLRSLLTPNPNGLRVPPPGGYRLPPHMSPFFRIPGIAPI
jgi:hypothetical protein